MSGLTYLVVGGGIVGVATALELLRREPGARLLLVEKEAELAAHQTGHNSGVIHAGVYYTPGSLKARLCREGAEDTIRFCRDHDIAYEQCGKLIVATNAVERDRMGALAERARANSIAFEELDAAGLARAEPAVAGIAGLRVPASGIVDYTRVVAAMAAEIVERGGIVRCGTAVEAIAEEDGHVEVVLRNVLGAREKVRAERLIACAGLQSDRLARLAGLPVEHRIVPFRGEYYVLPDALSGLVRHLIYPVPDPALPFLGIHLTRTIHGGITVGPNAVLGFAREGYTDRRFDRRDVADLADFGGFWRLMARNWRHGLGEFANSLSRRAYLAACRKYCPSLTLADLGGAKQAGIRAQAVMPDGRAVDDFLFLGSERMLHVCNAPSPAATSAMPIARMIVERLHAGAVQGRSPAS
ncbi:hydroxyglutarate oxidase [Novosphingobium nitrogenifigens DSM 19370]|uniref:Hydroxyglutarate oxidase n=1 Tax=Novosphingobium nitrogenifigens DSM 19370 TaxID=983920 RepID=F1ZD46_9SPHN|nr:hydroxyglutarate oxidase [Novosphingobium nitrogenifigens DSM 19370]